MKKIIFAAISLFLFSSCGVGTYSLASGKSDTAELSFIDDTSYNIEVEVDSSNVYEITTIKEKAYKSGRNIKNTTLNAITLTPGKHLIKVSVTGKLVYTKYIFVSTGEHKIIEL
jgi:phosphatidate phosphatase PAH1